MTKVGLLRSPVGIAHVGLAPEEQDRATAPVLHFEAVYEDNFAFVWRTCLRLGADPSLLDDVVQEVFLIAHRRLGDFEGRASVRTWLFAIARRTVARARRTARRKPLHLGVDEATELDRFIAQGDDPSVAAEHAQELRLVQYLLDQLDEEKREVFILSELEQMTIREIADAVSANPNTVASRIRAARTAFDRALSEWETSGGAT